MIYDLQPSNLHGLRRVSWVGSVLPQILYKSQNGGSGSRWSTIVIYLSDVWIFVTADNLCALVDSGRLVWLVGRSLYRNRILLNIKCVIRFSDKISILFFVFQDRTFPGTALGWNVTSVRYWCRSTNGYYVTVQNGMVIDLEDRKIDIHQYVYSQCVTAQYRLRMSKSYYSSISVWLCVFRYWIASTLILVRCPPLHWMPYHVYRQFLSLKTSPPVTALSVQTSPFLCSPAPADRRG